jgi:hypothetical protein
VKPNINSVEVHPQLSNNGYPVDGVLVVLVQSGWMKKHNETKLPPTYQEGYYACKTLSTSHGALSSPCFSRLLAHVFLALLGYAQNHATRFSMFFCSAKEHPKCSLSGLDFFCSAAAQQIRSLNLPIIQNSVDYWHRFRR